MFFLLIIWLFASFLKIFQSTVYSLGYLEQRGLGGVEFRVALDDGLHSWRIISYNQQSGAPGNRQREEKLVQWRVMTDILVLIIVYLFQVVKGQGLY